MGLSVAAERLHGNGGALTVITADRALLGTRVDGPGEPSAHGLTGPAEARLHAAMPEFSADDVLYWRNDFL